METINRLDSEVVATLRDLIEINMDSYQGFETAAEVVEGSDLSGLFRRIGEMRRAHADALRAYVTAEGAEQDSVTGKLHRWWIEARAKLQGGDRHAVLAEAERGEDKILHRYREALEAAEGSPVHAVLWRQYGEVKQHHDQMRAMRDRAAG